MLLQSWTFFVCVQDMFLDLAADRKIRSYSIKCPSRPRGCQWKGELRTKDVSLIYRRLQIPKRTFTIINPIIRSIGKSWTNYDNSYTNPTRRFCTFQSRDQLLRWCANLAKENSVQFPEEYLIRQRGRRFFVLFCWSDRHMHGVPRKRPLSSTSIHLLNAHTVCNLSLLCSKIIASWSYCFVSNRTIWHLVLMKSSLVQTKTVTWNCKGKDYETMWAQSVIGEFFGANSVLRHTRQGWWRYTYFLFVGSCTHVTGPVFSSYSSFFFVLTFCSLLNHKGLKFRRQLS